jgi:peptidoglycan hydrolase CwlO-like protein
MARNSAPPNKEILEAALQGLEAQRTKLDEQIAHVRSLMGRRAGRPPKGEPAVSEPTKHASASSRKKRVLSPEARKRIAAAQKKRWAAFRKGQ